MTSTNESPSLRERLSEIFQISSPQVENHAYFALIREELRQTEADLFKLLNKYGVQSVAEMNTGFQEGRIDEELAWEDYFQIDALEYKRDKLLAILDEFPQE
ncbi:MAG TPA: hypothetical protein VKK79_02035 [Candidatus Lokiarchaeia archaeon]|nr:hypothetical protein [Candidatus Lokiarchaeia archaeon]